MLSGFVHKQTVSTGSCQILDVCAASTFVSGADLISTVLTNEEEE